MSLYYKQPPSVMKYSPTGSDVPLDAVVEVHFTQDLDRTALAGALLLIDPQGQRVPGDLTYSERILRFRPHAPLQPGASYTVILKGVSSPGTTGVIRSVVGVEMGEDITFSFRTVLSGVLEAPVPVAPADGSTVSVPQLAWKPVSGADHYVVEVYRDPSLHLLSWSSEVSDTSVEPQSLPEGQYWWRVAARDAQGQTGPWSDPRTFLFIVSVSASVPVAPPPPVGEPEPTFYYHNRIVTRPLVSIDIEWPEVVNIKRLQVFREGPDGLETEVPVSYEWDGTILRIQQEGEG